MILAALCVQAAPTPMTLISDAEADPLRSAITRKEVWTQESARNLRADADRRMKEGPWSVTVDRPAGVFLSLNDYYSEAPFWWPNPTDPSGPYVLREGQINAGRFTANRNALNTMSETVFTLGAAAYLLDDSRYAQRASRILNIWFINPKTRMNPSLEYAQAIHGLNTGRAAGIIEGRAFIRAIQGMEFLIQTGGWDPKDQAAVRKWFADYLAWLTQSKRGLEEKSGAGDHAAWWAAQVAAVGSFLDDAGAEKAAFDLFRERLLPRQFRLDGSAPQSEAHETSANSIFNLEAFATLCRIAQVQGVDLWSARGKNGSNLSAVIDDLRPYLSDPRKWSREQISDLDSDGAYFLAFAGIGLKKPEYIALYRRLDRPDKAWPSLVDLMVGRWEAAGHQTRH